MTGQEKEIVEYRLNRAQETLSDARVLAQKGSWKSCVNRLYYACFYAVSALLSSKGLESSKHSGILSLFNLHIVKAGIISRETAEIFNDLYDDRHESDYADFVTVSGEQVVPQMQKVDTFIKAIRLLLE